MSWLDRTSTAIAVALAPASIISLSTVLMVDCAELGSGGNGDTFEASEEVFAATTTTSTVGTVYETEQSLSRNAHHYIHPWRDL